MSCNKKVLIPCITPSLKSPLPSIHVSTSTMGGRDAQASLTNYFWSMWEEKRGRYHTRMRDLTKWDGMIHMWESVTHFTRWHWMSCCWAGGSSETFSTSNVFKEPQTISFPGFSDGPHVSGSFFFFCEWNADEFPVLPTGVREEAMGWTMTLKDDFGVIAWTRRGAANNLSLFLLLSLFSFSVQSDIVFPRDRHFSWKAGKMSVALHRCECVNQCPFLTFQIETPR